MALDASIKEEHASGSTASTRPSMTSEVPHSRDASLRVWLTALAPILAFSLMVGLAYPLTELVVNCESPTFVPHSPGVTADSWGGLGAKMLVGPFSELRGRLTWCLTVLFVALTVSITLAAILDAMKVVRDSRFRFLLRFGAIASFPVFFVKGLKVTYDFNQTFLEKTVYIVAPVKYFIAAVEGMGHAALIGLALAVAAVLYGSARMILEDIPTEPGRAAARLADHQRTVSTLLYLGALALVAGTLESSALYAWATSLFDPDTAGYFGKGENLASAMGMLTGMYYSLFLAAIFVPGFGLLRHMANKLADLANPDATVPERRKWMKEHALDGSVPRQLVSLVAVFAPSIAGGPVVAVIQQVLG